MTPGRVLLAGFALLLPWAGAASQTTAPMPELDVLRAWIAEHHPALSTGDTRLNAVIVVVDTNARYVRSSAFSLSDTAMVIMQGGIELAVDMRHDTAWTARVHACIRDRSEPPATRPPLCLLDGTRVKDIENFRFFSSSAIVVLEGDVATKQFGAEASNGAVLVTTNRAALARYQALGVTSENLVSFVTRRPPLTADGAPGFLTVLMVRRP